MPTRLHLFLGPHLPCVAEMQNRLEDSTWADNWHVMNLGNAREGLTDPLIEERFEGIHPFFLDFDNLVISDENILGLPQEGLTLYPRARTFLGHFAEHDAEVHIALPRYTAFFPYAWLLARRHGFPDPFPETTTRRIWPRLLDEVTQALPRANLHVWLAEDIEADAEPLLRALGGDGLLDLAAPRDETPPPLPSLTAQLAHETVADLFAHPDPDAPDPSDLAYERLARLLPFHPDAAKAEYFEPEEAARLTERFEDHLGRIERRYGVIRPE